MSSTRTRDAATARGKSAETLSSILSFLSDFEREENVDLSTPTKLPPPAHGDDDTEESKTATGTTVLSDLLRYSLDSDEHTTRAPPRGPEAGATLLPLPGSGAADSIALISLRIKNARVQLLEKQAEIDVLKEQLRVKDERIAELDGSVAQQQEALRVANEQAIARHLETISKLVQDKSKLTQKIAALLKGFEQVEAKYQEKISKMRARYESEFNGKRDVLRNQEKLRRQKWEKAKIEEIREITVQGLQPEIQRLLEVHKADVRRVEQESEDKQAALRRQLAHEHQVEIQALQNRFRSDVEAATREQRDATARAMEAQQLKFEDLKQNLIKEKHVEMTSLKAQHAEEVESLQDAHHRVSTVADGGSGGCLRCDARM